MPFGGAGHLIDQIIHTARSQALFGIIPTKTYRLLPVFVPSIIYTILFHQWLSQIVITGLEPATPRWVSQHSNHTATPTCFKVELGELFYSHFCKLRPVIFFCLTAAPKHNFGCCCLTTFDPLPIKLAELMKEY